MAGLASRTGHNMGTWFRHRSNAIEYSTAMASRTASSDTCMIHRGTGEARGRFMAGLASRCSWYMVRWFEY